MQEDVEEFLGSRVWKYLKNIFPKMQQVEEIEIHGLVFLDKIRRKCSLTEKWKACKHNIGLVKLLMEKSMKLETLTIHLDHQTEIALSGSKDEFLFRLHEVLGSAGAHSVATIKLLHS